MGCYLHAALTVIRTEKSKLKPLDGGEDNFLPLLFTSGKIKHVHMYHDL